MWVAIALVLGTCAFIASAVGNPHDRGNEGFLLGLILGPIGIVVAALLPAKEASGTTRDCPWCAESIQRAALVCKHCGRDVETGELTQ